MSENRTPTHGPEDASANTTALHNYVVNHLDEAIEQGWIVPYYQPVVRTLTGKLCGFEALARWEDPQYGLLLPADFIAPLEQAKTIYKLDSCIIRQVCRHHREWANVGDPVVPVSFNLSRLDFDLCDIFDVVEKAVREYEVPRRMLNIEITETVLGTDPAFMITMMRRFHDVGYQVWMDDFGSGYSTLNVLKDFDFDELKIDMEFLKRFGDKAKTIIASVVDMAKKLGIQTLAEGVESEEHHQFLRRIGCEKMQGYLFGAPLPYSHQNALDMQKAIGVESSDERRYFSAIGAVNTLSLSERDFQAGNTKQDYTTSMPLAIVEYDGEQFSFVESNQTLRDVLHSIGIPSLDAAADMINDPSLHLGRSARHLMETIKQDRFARIDFSLGGTTCVIRARYITALAGKTAILVSIDSTIGISERKRHERIDEVLQILYSIYDHVDVLYLDKGTVEPIFSRAGFHEVYDMPSLGDSVRAFAALEIYPRDRERYLEFMDIDTMAARLEESGRHYLVSFFRVRAHGGNYEWKMFSLIEPLEDPGKQVVLCIRDTGWDKDALFQEAYDGYDDDGYHSLHEADMRITDGSLWRSIVDDVSMGLFWKDSERRFLGANKMFLEYYGFDSVDQIIGKTDEDMHWHVDPLPYQQDELRVLNDGLITRDVPGQCIVRGEIRDIAATKRPIYRNGRIVGLIGYFFDVAAHGQHAQEMLDTSLIDTVTGALNYTGLEAATSRYVDAFRRRGLDFGMIDVDIDSFKRINDEFGYAFGDAVLHRIAEELRTIMGNEGAIGHVYADRFVVLTQCTSGNELQELSERIEEHLVKIAKVNGTRCTIYAFTSYALYSESNGSEDMKQTSRKRMRIRKDRERSKQ